MTSPIPPWKKFGCAVCGANFDTKSELSDHFGRHYVGVPTLICEVCDFKFGNDSELEFHKKLYEHDEHHGPFPLPTSGDRACCASKSPPKVRRWSIDREKPKDEPKFVDSRVLICYDDLDDGLQCKDCKKQFKSRAHYNNHFLACTPVAPPLQAFSGGFRPKALDTESPFLSASSKQKDTFNLKAQVSKPMPTQTVTKANEHKRLQQHHATPTPPIATTDRHFCNTKGCDKSFRSEPALKQHKKDVHGVGGRKLDLDGRDSWMLGSRRCNPASTRAPPPTVHKPKIPLGSSFLVAQNQKPATHPAVMQASTNIGSVAAIEQAKEIHRRALRLLIQSDISIRPDGIVVDGISWSKIACADQDQILRTLDTMCHLPKQLQGEYLPGPKTFKDENQAYYSLADFISFSARDPGKPGLGAVVVICSKVALSDGCQEVVKIAAIDFSTGAILMNHLVCTDPQLSVTDWRQSVTGFSSWHDLEVARQAGYKVFKGWSSARAALQKYVDSETIIVGHNLRADLDVLRIPHGRAVDTAKVVEKAGNGPFSKQQLALDSLCRDTTTKISGVHPKYGRNPLMDAFAIRELSLWAIKNPNALEIMAKKRSFEYQRIPAVLRAAGGS